MSAELAHQKADKHLYVALHHKVRIRFYPLLQYPPAKEITDSIVAEFANYNLLF